MTNDLQITDKNHTVLDVTAYGDTVHLDGGYFAEDSKGRLMEIRSPELRLTADAAIALAHRLIDAAILAKLRQEQP